MPKDAATTLRNAIHVLTLSYRGRSYRDPIRYDGDDVIHFFVFSMMFAVFIQCQK